MPYLTRETFKIILTCTVILSCTSVGPVPNQDELFHASKWQVTGCGNTMIIMGALHSNDRPLTFDEETTKQVKAADVLATEINEKEFESKERLEKTYEHEFSQLKSDSNGLTAAYNRLSSLQTFELALAYLPADEREIFLDRVQKVKEFDVRKYLKAKSKLFFLAYETYGKEEEPSKDNSENGVESRLVQIRKNNKKQDITGLENIDYFFKNSYFDLKPDDVDEAQYLRILSYNMQGIIDVLDDKSLGKSVIKGDISVVARFRAMERKKWTTENFQKIYLNRENNFSEKLVELARDKSVFAAIGLLHLVGDDSVPSILENAYKCKVTRL